VDSEKLHIFEILAKQHESMLLAYVLSLVSDPQLAEDIAQDTFVIAYQKIATLRKPESFGPWLRGIARLEVFTVLRKRGKEISFEPAVLEGMEDIFGALEQNQATERWQERFQIVEDRFRALPEKLQQVCQLHYFEDQRTRATSPNLSNSA
jgi:RNA polymerase sigma factor (sigma-70 family)